MKKIFAILLTALITTSCMGPQGPQGEPGKDVNWKVYDFTIYSGDWQLYNGADQLGSYYMYIVEGSKAPYELEYVVKKYGEVTGTLVGTLNNGDNVFYPLPYECYYGEVVNGVEQLWSETYKFDYTHNSIAFYVYYSDFYTSTPPPTCTFRMHFKW